MPDWSYRTILRPLLFCLPPERARSMALGAMGRLGRLPGGSRVIEFFGHMAPSPRLRRTRAGLTFPTPVGIGWAVDPEACATHALAQFGVGFVETGPVSLAPVKPPGTMAVDLVREAIALPEPHPATSVDAMAARLRALPRVCAPLMVRLLIPAGTSAEECRRVVAALGPRADLLSVVGDGACLAAITRAAHDHAPPRGVLGVVPADAAADALSAHLQAVASAGADGVLVDGAVRRAAGGQEIGRPARHAALATVVRVREHVGPSVLVIAGGGIQEPADAVHLLDAGADVVTVDAGLVLTGPGLPKRINDAVLHTRGGTGGDDTARAPERAWFWTFLMGAGMLLGSLMAMGIAMTRVVLPYDEQFVGLNRAQLAAANARLLDFMAHDRVTLAGTMVAIGVLYTGLSYFGVRRGQHWAWVAVISSALVGFASFFLFLGFGYFDPFHAFVTVLLFQFLVLGVHCPLGETHETAAPGLHNDSDWLWSQWGQLLLVAHGVALAVAGLVISGVGVTQVFVPEDLEFMQTTREALAAIGPHLIPLVAHDRASFGGMLVVAGMAFLMTALWGFRRGRVWLWWTTLLAGIPGYVGAIGVHYAVGYHNWLHLTPAFAGLALFAAAMTLSYRYLASGSRRS
jgi:dihydroorotate dehydrogenase